MTITFLNFAETLFLWKRKHVTLENILYGKVVNRASTKWVNKIYKTVVFDDNAFFDDNDDVDSFSNDDDNDDVNCLPDGYTSRS